MSIMNGIYKFFSNNVKEIKVSEKRLKLFEYLNNNINGNSFIFLQETQDEFGGPLFFTRKKQFLWGGNWLLWDGRF